MDRPSYYMDNWFEDDRTYCHLILMGHDSSPVPTHTHTRIYTHTRIHTHTHVYTCTYTHTHTYVYTHIIYVHNYICKYIHIYIYIYARAYTYIYIYMCIYMYIYMYIHTFTHTHTYIYIYIDTYRHHTIQICGRKMPLLLQEILRTEMAMTAGQLTKEVAEAMKVPTKDMGRKI